MRKILECISWVILDDLLLYRGAEYHWVEDYIPPLRMPNRRWYEWARKKGLMIRGLNELEKKIKIVANTVAKELNIRSSDIKKITYKKLTYPLFILLLGRKVNSIRIESNVFIPVFKSKHFIKYCKDHLRDILIESIGKGKIIKNDEIVEEIIAKLTGNTKLLVFPYPSTSFIIQLISKITKINLISLYNEYSYFVHTYDKAWQIYPFSSVLEFKILKHELNRFYQVIMKLIEFYQKEIS